LGDLVVDDVIILKWMLKKEMVWLLLIRYVVLWT